jgi:hypothetical protein
MQRVPIEGLCALEQPRRCARDSRRVVALCRRAESARKAPVATPTNTGASSAPKDSAELEEQQESPEEFPRVEYVPHPQFPKLPASVPLTFTLTMVACLSPKPEDRPTFAQVLTVLLDVEAEVVRGRYMNSVGLIQVLTVKGCCWTAPPLLTYYNACASWVRSKCLLYSVYWIVHATYIVVLISASYRGIRVVSLEKM